MLKGVHFAACALICGAAALSEADIIVRNAATPADNAAERASWLADAGIAAPQFLVDFESIDVGTNVDDVTGLFPGDLVFRDTSTANQAIIRDSSTFFGGSNPVGTRSLAHNEQAFLEFDFTAAPVDYVAFLDIDNAGAVITVHFVGGGTDSFSIETTGSGGDSAEFVGIFRNDMPQITRLQIDASGDGEWGVDMVEYGVVPEPASMLALAGLGLAALRRRRA